MLRSDGARAENRFLSFETLEIRLPFSVTPIALETGDLDSPQVIAEPGQPDPFALNVQQTLLLSDYGNFADALAAAGETPTRLVVDVQHELAADVDLAATILLEVSGSGRIDLGGNQLTIQGEFESTATGIFEGSGNVVFKSGSTESLRARWWSGNDTQMIEKALLSATVSEVKHVQLDGEYTIDYNIRFDSPAYSGITLAGEGASTIVYTRSTSTNGILTFEVDGRAARIDDLTFENFVLDGNNAFASQGIYAWHGQEAYGIYGMKIHSITARNFGKVGFYLGGNIEGTQLLSHDNGMHGFVARDGNVVLDQVEGYRNYIGLDIAGGRNGFQTTTTVRNFSFRENAAFGAKYGVRDVTHITAEFFDGEFLDNANNGFTITYPDDVTDFSNLFTSMTRVTASGNGFTGFMMKAGTAYLQDIVADSNSNAGLTAGGLMTTGDNITITNNGNMGIFAQSCQLSNVHATGNAVEGVRVNYGECSITNGYIADNGAYGIKAFGSTASFQAIEFGQPGSQVYDMGAWFDSSVTLRSTPDTNTVTDSSSSFIEDLTVEHHRPVGGDGQRFGRGLLERPQPVNDGQEQTLPDKSEGVTNAPEPVVAVPSITRADLEPTDSEVTRTSPSTRPPATDSPAVEIVFAERSAPQERVTVEARESLSVRDVDDLFEFDASLLGPLAD